MAESESKSTTSESKSTKAKSSGPKESVAEAPGPITPEHESGSFEQTKAVEDAREALNEARGATNK
jgi:hypothetical protein